MCMIMNPDTKEVLVQNRKKGDWNGISFPGGHVEKEEPLIPAVIRGIFEETGLMAKDLVPCGFKDWYDYEKEERYIVLFFKTSSYQGTLLPESKEGKNCWMTIPAIRNSKVADDFLEMLDIFTGESGYLEFFYEDQKGEKDRWVKRFY